MKPMLARAAVLGGRMWTGVLARFGLADVTPPIRLPDDCLAQRLHGPVDTRGVLASGALLLRLAADGRYDEVAPDGCPARARRDDPLADAASVQMWAVALEPRTLRLELPGSPVPWQVDVGLPERAADAQTARAQQRTAADRCPGALRGRLRALPAGQDELRLAQVARWLQEEAVLYPSLLETTEEQASREREGLLRIGLRLGRFAPATAAAPAAVETAACESEEAMWSSIRDAARHAATTVRTVARPPSWQQDEPTWRAWNTLCGDIEAFASAVSRLGPESGADRSTGGRRESLLSACDGMRRVEAWAVSGECLATALWARQIHHLDTAASALQRISGRTMPRPTRGAR